MHSDLITDSIITSHILHKDRRDYLKSQLRHILYYCNEPKNICRKFSKIAAAIGFAKDEIFWYFYHFDRDYTLSKSTSKKQKAESRHDLGILELMSLTVNLTDKIIERGEGIEHRV